MTHGDVIAALNALGHNPKSIARNLRYLGIKGSRGSSISCPVAVHLQQQYPHENIFVDSTSVVVCDNNAPLSFSVQLPKIVKKFVKRFDKGKYRYLDANKQKQTDN